MKIHEKNNFGYRHIEVLNTRYATFWMTIHPNLECGWFTLSIGGFRKVWHGYYAMHELKVLWLEARLVISIHKSLAAKGDG